MGHIATAKLLFQSLKTSVPSLLGILAWALHYMIFIFDLSTTAWATCN